MVSITETKVLPEEKAEQKKSKLVIYGQTVNLNLGCLGMGLMTSVIGATLVDLTEIYSTHTEQAAHIITFRGCGALIGSLFGGMLLDKFNTQVLMTTAVLVASIATTLIPVCPTLSIAYGVTFIYGLSVGVFDTGASICIINLWGKKTGPMLQMYHFAFGVGGLLAPIVADPFLSLNDEGTQPRTSALRQSRVGIPYGIIGLVHFMLFISMLVFYSIDSSDTKPPAAVQNEGVTASKCKRYTLLMCLSFYLMVYDALESCLGQMLSTFAVKSKLRFSKTQASYLSFLFWTTFTMSRMFSVFWALKSTPRCMILTELFMMLSAFSMFLWFGETYQTMAWVFSAMVGIGAAGMYATAITWTVEFMPLTNKMMSISTVFSGSGDMAPPLIVGPFIDENPMILMKACGILCLLLIIITVIMTGVTDTMTPRKSMVIDTAELDYVEDVEKGAKAVVMS